MVSADACSFSPEELQVVVGYFKTSLRGIVCFTQECLCLTASKRYSFIEYYKSFGENRANCAAYGFTVKCASLQSDGLAFPPSCCVALGMFPPLAKPPLSVG